MCPEGVSSFLDLLWIRKESENISRQVAILPICRICFLKKWTRKNKQEESKAAGWQVGRRNSVKKSLLVCASTNFGHQPITALFIDQQKTNNLFKNLFFLSKRWSPANHSSLCKFVDQLHLFGLNLISIHFISMKDGLKCKELVSNEQDQQWRVLLGLVTN